LNSKRVKEEAGPAVEQPSRLRTPPGVGTPLQAAGRPAQRHPPGTLRNPLAKERGGALQSLIDRSALSGNLVKRRGQ